MKKKIAVFTGGGDCPGLNNAIKEIVTSAGNNFEVEGIIKGWEGAIKIAIRKDAKTLANYTTLLNEEAVRRIDRFAGTILMTSRANPFNYTDTIVKSEEPDVSEKVMKFLNEKYYAVIAIGGEDTLGAAGALAERGLRVIGLPKTIDKDLAGTQFTLGYDSAVSAAKEAINNLKATAGSHGRVAIVETMGRHAGHIAFHAGKATHVPYIITPEILTDVTDLCAKIYDRKLTEEEEYPGFHLDGRRYTMVVIAEGARLKNIGEVTQNKQKDAYGHKALGGVADILAHKYKRLTGDKEVLVQRLGYLVRSIPPSNADCVRGQDVGCRALELITNEQFGRMVTIEADDSTSDIPLSSVVNKLRVIDVQKCYDAENYRPKKGLPRPYYEKEVPKVAGDA